MIAYSAIDSGALVFGNTAIKALFDDADDLGTALNNSSTLEAGAMALGQILAQFSGQLAYGKIEEADHPEVVDGVLSLDSAQRLLTVDFSDALWSVKKEGVNPGNYIVGRDTFINAYVGGIHGITQDIGEQMIWLWGTDNSNVIDRFSINLGSSALNTTLSDRASSENLTGKASVTLTVATDQDDTIKGSNDNDFIIGGDGNDTLIGSLGKDLLSGGSGDDLYISSGENTIFVGGEGNDTADYSYGPGYSNAGSVNFSVADDYIGGTRVATNSVDKLYSVENVKLSYASDSVEVTSWDQIDGHLTIDGSGQNTTAGDQIDFSGMDAGVVFDTGGKVVGTKHDDVFQDSTSHNISVDLGDGADIVKSAGAGTLIDLGTEGHD
eukprot:gene28960-37356_t